MACVLYIRDTVLAVRQVGNGPSKRQRLACFRAFVHESHDVLTHTRTRVRWAATYGVYLRCVSLASHRELVCVHTQVNDTRVPSSSLRARYWRSLCATSKASLRAKDSAKASILQVPSIDSRVNPLFRVRDHARTRQSCTIYPTITVGPTARSYSRTKGKSGHRSSLTVVSRAGGPLYTSPREGGGSTCNNVAHISVSTLRRIYVYKVVGARRGFRSFVLLVDLIGIDKREECVGRALTVSIS